MALDAGLGVGILSPSDYFRASSSVLWAVQPRYHCLPGSPPSHTELWTWDGASWSLADEPLRTSVEGSELVLNRLWGTGPDDVWFIEGPNGQTGC